MAHALRYICGIVIMKTGGKTYQLPLTSTTEDRLQTSESMCDEGVTLSLTCFCVSLVVERAKEVSAVARGIQCIYHAQTEQSEAGRKEMIYIAQCKQKNIKKCAELERKGDTC